MLDSIKAALFTVKAGLIIAGIIGMLGLGTVAYAKVWNKGWTAALAAVHKKDMESNGKASDAISAVKSCDDRGGTWDTTTGVCQ